MMGWTRWDGRLDHISNIGELNVEFPLMKTNQRAVNSVRLECDPYKVEVGSSNLPLPTDGELNEKFECLILNRSV